MYFSFFFTFSFGQGDRKRIRLPCPVYLSCLNHECKGAGGDDDKFYIAIMRYPMLSLAYLGR